MPVPLHLYYGFAAPVCGLRLVDLYLRLVDLYLRPAGGMGGIYMGYPETDILPK
jgi:hypothetical protein